MPNWKNQKRDPKWKIPRIAVYRVARLKDHELGNVFLRWIPHFLLFVNVGCEGGTVHLHIHMISYYAKTWTWTWNDICPRHLKVRDMQHLVGFLQWIVDCGFGRQSIRLNLVSILLSSLMFGTNSIPHIPLRIDFLPGIKFCRLYLETNCSGDSSVGLLELSNCSGSNKQNALLFLIVLDGFHMSTASWGHLRLRSNCPDKNS